MSIPPLVCSTPPPLEQCEDDKDAEDFDLQYNLSTYDDDEGNDYNYGSFNTFNDIQATTLEEPIGEVFSNQVVEKVETDSDNVKSKEIATNIESIIDKNQKQLSNEEEVNIEDLNLKLDEEEPPDKKEDSGESIEDKIEVHTNIENVIASVPHSSFHIDVSNCTVDKPMTKDFDDEVSSKSDNKGIETKNESIFSNEIKDQIYHNNQDHVECSVDVNCKTNSPTSNGVKNEEGLDDDFDDFQFISMNNKPLNETVQEIVPEESPWGKEDLTDSDFGNFTANFEDIASQSQQENSSDDNKPISVDDDDDFGDFDEFQSSAAGVKSDNNPEELPQQVPVLNLPSFPESENQLMENINKVLTSIFKEEIMESEEILEAKLDSVLNETWGHLMETDVRQPYIVNWNNSLAQKTLLKALCIDSRNILFGPKWSYSMPKYAANLTAAPLQPQKQASTSNIQRETINPDKGATKSAMWSDPFESNGQESCSNDRDNAVIEPRPTDLDVFEAAMSTKKDKIYSSTISVQPIRQINLPDTHIFTPTDSETPRSKTIHYDCSPAPTVLLPQPVMDAIKSDDSNPVINPVTVAPTHADTDEYWEFQDFKGTSGESNPQPSEKEVLGNNATTKPNVTYQTQLLQPIKLEPIIPTLNWPDPGEIKETFEDFSDFMTNSTSSSKAMSEEHSRLTNAVTSQVMSVDIDLKEGSSKNNDSFDDDFDTFQSAVPPKQDANIEFGTIDSKMVYPNSVHDLNLPQQETNLEFKCVFPNNNIIKSDDISFTNFTKPLDALPQHIDSKNHKAASSSGINLTSSSILQPTPTGTLGQVLSHPGTIQNQQKSGQILQPLSLESYSQINWPNPGIDLQDLSRFNPVETLPSLKSETSGNSKVGTPIHNQKTVVSSQASDDDIWGEFVSSNPKLTPSLPKKAPALVDDDEWTDFVSSSSVKPQNGLNTISFNVHTNSNMQKTPNQNIFVKSKQIPLDIPSLHYITPKSGNHKSYNDKHFQNL